MRVASVRPHRPPLRPLHSLPRLSLVWLAVMLAACTEHGSPTAPARLAVPPPEGLLAGAPLSIPAQGQYIFRHWTFGDEPFWTDTLRLNEAVETAVSPATALAVGLKVDAERLPPGFLTTADLNTPATTVESTRSKETGGSSMSSE